MDPDDNSKHHYTASMRIPVNATWNQNSTIVAGGNGHGGRLDQLSSPSGLCIDDENDTLYIADYDNHRIMEWKSGATSGQVAVGENGQGDQEDQLNGPTSVIYHKQADSLIICDSENRRLVRWPRDGLHGEAIITNIKCMSVAITEDGYIYVSDAQKHAVRLWRAGEPDGVVVAGGNGQGDNLDQLNNPTHIFVDRHHSVYVSDQQNHRVMKWATGAKEGIVVAGGQGVGSALTQLSLPQGIVVDHHGVVYVAEFWNHRVLRCPPDTTTGSIVVGGNGTGDEENQLNSPDGLTFDRHGNLYVVSNRGHRVQKFAIETSHHDQ